MKLFLNLETSLQELPQEKKDEYCDDDDDDDEHFEELGLDRDEESSDSSEGQELPTH